MSLIEGTSSRELRERCMQQRFVPIAREVLRRCPDVHSVGFLVGQYWCDEAEDAVHEAIVPFAERDPVWPPHGPEEEAMEEAVYEQLDPFFADEPGGFYGFTCYFPELDSNTSRITAFAAYCSEGCHQEMTLAESHLLYAVARRAGDDVELTVVGNLLRPEWEDRFDVGFDISEEEQARKEAEMAEILRKHGVPTSPTRRVSSGGGGLFGLLRRLFGRR